MDNLLTDLMHFRRVDDLTSASRIIESLQLELQEAARIPNVVPLMRLLQ